MTEHARGEAADLLTSQSLPMDLCHEPAEWGDWVVRVGSSSLGQGADPGAELRSFVTAEFGARALDTHEWCFTPGSGAMLSYLLGSVPPCERGAVLPAYQALAAALLPGETRTSTVVDPTEWVRARFSPPQQTPTVMVVNSLHANPLAASLPIQFLTDLAGYAQDTGALLIEDDAFRGTGNVEDPAPALLTDYPVVHLGTWTKMLGWPVKLGFVGWPRGHATGARLRASAPTVPLALLESLTATLASGRTKAIRARRCARLARRRTDLTRLLTDLGLSFVPPTGGAHVALLTGGDHRLRHDLVAEGIGGLDWSSFYPLGVPSPDNPILRLGISNVAEADWAALTNRLAKALITRSGAERG